MGLALRVASDAVHRLLPSVFKGKRRRNVLGLGYQRQGLAGSLLDSDRGFLNSKAAVRIRIPARETSLSRYAFRVPSAIPKLQNSPSQ